MKSTLAWGVSALLAFSAMQANAQTKPLKNVYQYAVNLTDVKDDKLKVELVPPVQTSDVVVYNMPQVIPGTYADYDFGRFVSDFRALDAKGNELKVTRLNPNQWQIDGAKKLAKVEYLVEDTWDTDIKEQFVFEPGGSNWEAGKNFTFNNSCLFGYFGEQKRAEYRMTFTKPEGFFGSTSMVPAKTSATQDYFVMPNYMDVVDAPIMYCKPDTAMIPLGDAEVLVSVYSRTGKNKAADLKNAIARTVTAQRAYLGKLPVNRYAFIIYLADGPYKSGSAGALEHSYSSLYSLFEGDSKQIADNVVGVAAHEFFHIITPLNIHAEEIGNFDYVNPKMSKHLWMYEGCTEYFAQHAQIHEGLMEAEEFLAEMRGKMVSADRYNVTAPFTVFSKNILEPEHAPKFGNVYSKGALIGMLLDIRLHELSGGKMSLVQLMGELSKVYGKDKSFQDDELFDKITSLTYPEIRDFFRRYVEGAEPLPYGEYLAKVGIQYIESAKKKEFSFGGVRIGYNPDRQALFIADVSRMNDFGKALGYQQGDELVSVNGTTVSLQNAQQVLQGFPTSLTEGQDVQIVVRRKNANGELEEKTLTAKAMAVEVEQRHMLAFNPNATPEQVALREAWLKN